MTPMTPTPSTPRFLGVAGVLPFLLLAPLSVMEGPYQATGQDALIAYGAVILSFVGALHWAFAMLAEGLAEPERTRHYLWSVTPALIGWVAVWLPLETGLILLLAGFVFDFLFDRHLARRAALPIWYLPLRLGLTLTVSLTLGLTLMALWF